MKVGGRRWKAGFSGLVLTLALCSCGASAGTGTGTGATRPGAGTSSSPTTSSPSGRVQSSSPVWKSSVVANVKLAAILAAADGVSAYAITVRSTSPTSTNGRLARIDLATGRVEQGSALPSASQLFLVGPKLYVLEPLAGKAGQLSGPWTLYRLGSGADLTRIGPLPLGLSADVPLVTPTGPSVAGTTDTWIGVGSNVVELNLATGAVLRRVPAENRVTSISVSPDGKLMYAAVNRTFTNAVADPAAVITERHAATGAVIATTGVRFSTNGADLHAVAGGVWASYRLGMAGDVELLDATGLGPIVSPGKLPGSVWKDLSQGGAIIQGPSVAVLDGYAWLSSPTGIACLQASTGRFRGGAPLPKSANESLLAQTTTGLYLIQAGAANGSTDIVRAHPPTGCPGRQGG